MIAIISTSDLNLKTSNLLTSAHVELHDVACCTLITRVLQWDMACRWCPGGSRTRARPIPSSVTDTSIASVAAMRRSAVSLNQTVNQRHCISISVCYDSKSEAEKKCICSSSQWGLDNKMSCRSWPRTPATSFPSAMLAGIRNWLPRPVDSSGSEGVWNINMFIWKLYFRWHGGVAASQLQGVWFGRELQLLSAWSFCVFS